MVRTIIITAELVNPTGEFKDEIKLDVPPDASPKAVCLQVAAQVSSGPGLVNVVSEDEVEVIPMVRVKSIHVKMQSVVLSNPLEAAAAVRQSGSRIVAG